MEQPVITQHDVCVDRNLREVCGCVQFVPVLLLFMQQPVITQHGGYVDRDLPELGRHFVMRLLFVEQPVAQAVVSQWISRDAESVHFTQFCVGVWVCVK